MNETNATLPVSAAPGHAARTEINRYAPLDGNDPGAALRAGLEITGICIAGIAVILTIYYFSLRLLAAAFPPKPADEAPEVDD